MKHPRYLCPCRAETEEDCICDDLNYADGEMLPRIVSQFSCGAASAVATKLTLSDYSPSSVTILNAYIEEEHKDNRRFLVDCEKWFDHPITVVRDEVYSASVVEVIRRNRFFASGLYGAPCSGTLKREVLAKYQRPDDILVLGYTSEEQKRVDDFLDANNGRKIITPLIDRNLSKADCLAIVSRAGIELPYMYRAGYNNANCIGCVKGGQGYWNKIRRDFPEQFNRMADLQESIGPGAYIFRNRETGERFSLRDNPLDAGRHNEPDISCSAFCVWAEDELEK